ncbi:MAG: hypothetical protein M0011_03800 [Elusimicrobia bacterium]|nr:hypothetical protein [Elusimicrobiota bacterium]
MKKYLMIVAVLCMAGGARAADFDALGGVTAAGIRAGLAGIEAALPGVHGNAQGKTLVDAKTMQLQVEQNSVNLADYEATLIVNCMYRSGLWPQPHVCGSRVLPVEITSDGRLILPPIEAFDGPRGANPDNFDLRVTVARKGDPRDWLFTLGASGRKGLAAYARKTGAISLLKLNAAKVEVLVEGKPLAGSAMAQDQSSRFMAFVDSAHVPGEDIDPVVLATPLTGIQSLDNAQHSYPKPSLAAFRALEFGSAVMVEWADSPRGWSLFADLRLGTAYTVTESYRGRAKIERSVDGLQRIVRLDLVKAY